MPNPGQASNDEGGELTVPDEPVVPTEPVAPDAPPDPPEEPATGGGDSNRGQRVPDVGVWSAVIALLVLGVLLGFAVIQAWPPASSMATASSAASGCSAPTPSPTAGTSQPPTPSPHQSAASGVESPANPSASASAAPPTELFAPACLYGFINLPTAPDGRLLSIVLIAGAIGGTIYALRSMAMFAGNRTLVWSWMPLYAAMPLVGGLLGQVFYFLLRAGFLSPSTPTSDVSPYGFATVAALAGLFAGQALEKLKNVFEQIFAKIPDQANPVVPLTITNFSPAHAKFGDPIQIFGTGLSRVTLVTFGGNVTALPGGGGTDTTIAVRIPPGATDGPITVSGSGGLSASANRDFKVDPPAVAPPSSAAATISNLSPDHAQVNSDVTIAGTGLAQVTHVMFAGGVSAVPALGATDTSLTVNVPAGAESGPVIVLYPGGKVASPTAFTVDT